MGRNFAFVALGLVLGLLGSYQLPTQAQRAIEVQDDRGLTPRLRPEAGPTRPGPRSIQDSLLQPYSFAFGSPTTLSDVVKRLNADLGGHVVLDLAALDRQDVDKTDTVELDLAGVRLKTGLKLLLDQQGLTYRLEPEDDLLIITDQDGADDPLEKVSSELGHMHREIHDLQDAVDELLDASGDPGAGGRLRQPTIIEEMPGGPAPEGVAPDPTVPDDAPHLEESQPPKRPRTRL